MALCWIAICRDFVEKTIYLAHLFVQDSKTRSGSDFRRHYTA